MQDGTQTLEFEHWKRQPLLAEDGASFEREFYGQVASEYNYSRSDAVPATPSRFDLVVADRSLLDLDVDPFFWLAGAAWSLCEFLGEHETACWRIMFFALSVLHFISMESI